MIREANKKLTDNTPQAAHIRDFYDVMITSFSNLLNDLKQDRQLWSNLMVDKQPKMVSFNIAPDVSIFAFKIMHPEECAMHKGYWCRSMEDKKFYIFVNGCIFGGICTDILNESEQVVKFDEHLNAANCNPKDTSLYVPHELNPKSDDRRILTNRMQYMPSHCEDNEPYPYRIGSAKFLKSDVSNMSDADYRLFNDISIHFMLCLTIAGREFISRRV